MSISCSFSVAKCVYSMLFRLWGSWMILSGLEASLVLRFGSWQNGGVDFWSAKVSLDSMLLISGLAGFNILFPKCRLLASSGAECLLLGFFRGRMSSWCSFRCTCLDELESKSDLNTLYHFCCKMCVFFGFQTARLMDDCFWSGGFFGVVIWFMTKWWCWLLISKSFAGFDVAVLRSRWIQFIFPKCRFLASSGAECLPGVHSDARA